MTTLMKHSLRLLATLLLSSLAPVHAADLRLGSPFSDHMVLQREKPVAVWGWADADESVTVAFDGQTKTATAGAEGKWSLKLDALEASADSRMFTVTGKDGRKVVVNDVLVGEVWLGSGQSNMEVGVQGSNNFDVEKPAANFPLIRHYKEASSPSEKPQAEGKGLWKPCTPANVGGFSATLYFFGRRLSLWALGTVYGKDVPAISGPLPADSSVSGNAISVSFKHANGGLKTKDGGAVKGFHIAGADQQWKVASAKIDGDKIIVSSPDVTSPVAVRYAWADNPACNLTNGAGLPASPFRTDDW